MSDAKKCDRCKGLYEKNDSDNIVDMPASPNSREKLEAMVVIRRKEDWSSQRPLLVDNDPQCAVTAVRALMRKYNIDERKGDSFTCTLREGKRHVIYFENGPALSKEDNDAAQDKNRDFFAGFNGKRVRITVEVLS